MDYHLIINDCVEQIFKPLRHPQEGKTVWYKSPKNGHYYKGLMIGMVQERFRFEGVIRITASVDYGGFLKTHELVYDGNPKGFNPSDLYELDPETNLSQGAQKLKSRIAEMRTKADAGVLAIDDESEELDPSETS